MQANLLLGHELETAVERVAVVVESRAKPLFQSFSELPVQHSPVPMRVESAANVARRVELGQSRRRWLILSRRRQLVELLGDLCQQWQVVDEVERSTLEPDPEITGQSLVVWSEDVETLLLEKALELLGSEASGHDQLDAIDEVGPRPESH